MLEGPSAEGDAGLQLGAFSELVARLTRPRSQSPERASGPVKYKVLVQPDYLLS